MANPVALEQAEIPEGWKLAYIPPRSTAGMSKRVVRYESN